MKNKFYKKSGNTYVTQDTNIVMIGIGIIFLFFGLKSLINGYEFSFQNFNAILKSLSPFWILLGLVCFGKGMLRVRLLPKDFKMVKEYMFGLYKKAYQISTPLNITVSTTYKQERRIESYVKVDTNRGNISIRIFPRSRDVEPFIEGTNEIFK